MDPFTPKVVDLSGNPAAPSDTSTAASPSGPDPALAGPTIKPNFGGPPAPPGKPVFSKSLFIKIFVVLLLLIIPISVYVAVNYKTVFNQKAAGCVDYGFTLTTNSGRNFDTKPVAFATGNAFNHCTDAAHTLTLNKFWCLSNAIPPAGCSDNVQTQRLDIQPNTPQQAISVSQAVPNDGACGAAQVDLAFEDIADWSKPEDQYHVGFFAKADVSCHMACANNACTITTGDGTNSCTLTNGIDSCAPTHKACQNNACASVSGSGTDSCTTDSDCAAATHKACQNQACATVSGAGTNSCTSDADCKTVTHLECSANKTCLVVSGSGTNGCSTDSDCIGSHKACQNNACTTVSGSGSDSCSSDNDCKSTPTHKTCQNQSCVTVSGSGSDSCTSDAMCKPAATPPPVPTSGITTPTMVGIGAGALLTIFGAALLL